MDFYPKYGYKPVQESTFTFEANKFSSEQNQLQKLVISDPDTQTKIYDLAKTRKVLSKQFGVLNGHKLFMYHCLYPFRDCLYYLESENLLVICKKKGDELHIYDLIWQDNIDFKRIVRKITDERIRRILLHFTPDLLNVDTISELSTDNSSLFVRNISPKDVPDNILHPVTSEA